MVIEKYSDQNIRYYLSLCRFKSMDKIIRDISIEFEVTVDEIKGQSRKREFVIPRMFGMYCCKMSEYRDSKNRSLKQIGRTFGNRDHSTVLHALKEVNNMIEMDLGLNKYFENITKNISENFYQPIVKKPIIKKRVVSNLRKTCKRRNSLLNC